MGVANVAVDHRLERVVPLASLQVALDLSRSCHNVPANCILSFQQPGVYSLSCQLRLLLLSHHVCRV